MALFKRADLEAQGFSKEQIEYIMTESGRSLASNYTLKSDVQAQIDAAVAAAKPEPIDPKTTKDYLDIVRERDMLRAVNGEEFAQVKPKFRETVFGMIDRSEGAKPIQDQLNSIKEQFEEYYIPDQPKDPKPQFGSPDKGKMPTGEQGDAAKFTEAWGFGPKKI